MGKPVMVCEVYFIYRMRRRIGRDMLNLSAYLSLVPIARLNIVPNQDQGQYHSDSVCVKNRRYLLITHRYNIFRFKNLEI